MSTEVDGQPERNSHDSRTAAGAFSRAQSWKPCRRKYPSAPVVKQVQGLQLQLAGKVLRSGDEQAADPLAAIVGFDGHAAEQPIVAADLQSAQTDEAAGVPHDQVVPEPLRHTMVGEVHAVEQLPRRGEVVGLSLLRAEPHGRHFKPGRRSRPH